MPLVENNVSDGQVGSAQLLQVASGSQRLGSALRGREGRLDEGFPISLVLVGTHPSYSFSAGGKPPLTALGSLSHAPDLSHLGSSSYLQR